MQINEKNYVNKNLKNKLSYQNNFRSLHSIMDSLIKKYM